MGQMKDDKGEDDQPAQPHRAGENRGSDRIRGDVFLRTRGFIFLPELHREINVSHEDSKQRETDHPEERAKALELGSVGVDRIRAEEDGEVSDEVADDECHEGNSSDGDGSFFSNRGI
jgi:hypothetical protein